MTYLKDNLSKLGFKGEVLGVTIYEDDYDKLELLKFQTSVLPHVLLRKGRKHSSGKGLISGIYMNLFFVFVVWDMTFL